MHPVARDEVYRVALEAIRNACIHSRASLLTIELHFGRDLMIRVNDNGRGFDTNLVHSGKPGHFGISGMKERASKIGARVSFANSLRERNRVLSCRSRSGYFWRGRLAALRF